MFASEAFRFKIFIGSGEIRYFFCEQLSVMCVGLILLMKIEHLMERITLSEFVNVVKVLAPSGSLDNVHFHAYDVIERSNAKFICYYI